MEITDTSTTLFNYNSGVGGTTGGMEHQRSLATPPPPPPPQQTPLGDPPAAKLTPTHTPSPRSLTEDALDLEYCSGSEAEESPERALKAEGFPEEGK